jgi:O-antigen/teichoic acid export membrane protein
MLGALRERLIAYVPKGRVARGIATLASGTAAAQGITICAMPVITRLYTPAQIGVISIFIAFFSFWGATLSLRYEYALLIADNDTESHYVHRLAVALVIVMSLFGLPLLLVLHRTRTLGFGLLPEWASLVVVPILLGYGLFMVYRSWALRAGMVRAITKATISRSVANAGVSVALGLAGGGVLALFAAQIAGAWGALISLARTVGRRYSPGKPHRIAGSDLLRVARKFVKFSTFETPSAWVNQLVLALPLPMIASLQGATAAGWFGLARTMVGIPNSQIGNAVADVFQMELANAVVVGDVQRARGLFYKLMRKLALVGLLPLIGTLVLGPWLVPRVFGHEWSDAGYAAAAIAPWLYAALVVSPLSRTLSVIQAQEYKLIYDISALAFLVMAFMAGKIWHFTFLGLVLGISAAGFLGYVVYAILIVAVVEFRLRKTVT